MQRGRSFYFAIDGHGGEEGAWESPPRNTILNFGCNRNEYMSLDQEQEQEVEGPQQSVTPRTATVRHIQSKNISETPNDNNNYQIEFESFAKDPKQGVYNMNITDGKLVKLNKLIGSSEETPDEMHTSLEEIDNNLRSMFDIKPTDKVKYYLIMCRGTIDPFDNFGDFFDITEITENDIIDEQPPSKKSRSIGGKSTFKKGRTKGGKSHRRRTRTRRRRTHKKSYRRSGRRRRR